MRVSTQMMSDTIKSYLSRQAGKMVRTQEQIASGKRINRASDDPIGMQQALGYRSMIASIEQYDQNIDSAKMRAKTVDDILGSIGDLLADAKKFAADPDPDLRDSFAEQVATIRDQVLQMANYQLNGEYLFSGNLTDTPPFDSSGAYAGDNGSRDYMIGDHLQIAIEADGSRVFQGSVDIFAALDDLQSALQSGDSTAIHSQEIPLGDAVKQLDGIRAQNASRSKRLDSTRNYYDNTKVNVQQLLSQTEDADMASSIIDLQNQQTAYQATLGVAAKIIQPTLMDFLK